MAKIAKEATKKIKVSGQKAILIDEIVALNEKNKANSVLIAEKRATLEKVHKLGGMKVTYLTKKGGILEIGVRKSFTEIKPLELLRALKAKRLGAKFPECVSVVLGKVQKILSEDDIKGLRKEGNESYTWSFK